MSTSCYILKVDDLDIYTINKLRWIRELNAHEIFKGYTQIKSDVSPYTRVYQPFEFPLPPPLYIYTSKFQVREIYTILHKLKTSVCLSVCLHLSSRRPTARARHCAEPETHFIDLRPAHAHICIYIHTYTYTHKVFFGARKTTSSFFFVRVNYV